MTDCEMDHALKKRLQTIAKTDNTLIQVGSQRFLLHSIDRLSNDFKKYRGEIKVQADSKMHV